MKKLLKAVGITAAMVLGVIGFVALAGMFMKAFIIACIAALFCCLVTIVYAFL